MKKKKQTFLAMTIISGLSILLGILTFQISHEAQAKKPILNVQQKNHSMRSIDVAGKNFQETVKLGAIGDILIHDTVYESAHSSSGYDFKPVLTNVKQLLTDPDLLLANQETILGGVEIGLSSYPAFNSPVEIGDALLDAGVDIVSNANNHSLDRSEKGVLTSIRNMEAAGLPYVGSFKDDADQQT